MFKEITENKSAYIKNSVLPLLYLVFILFALRWTVVEPYVVPTGSMEPTLKTGDRLYALKCAYDVRFPFTEWILFRTGTVKRGDTILFRAPQDPAITYVKRAIGLPGDRIEFRQGELWINGKQIAREPAKNTNVMYDIEHKDDKTLYIENLEGVHHHVILDEHRPNLRTMEEITVPEGHLFAVGDNRDNSYDSRAWGFVPMENLKGKGIFIWYSSWDYSRNQLSQRSAHDFTFIDTLLFWNWTTRPERVGTLIK